MYRRPTVFMLLAVAIFGLFARQACAADTADQILSYAESKTFIDNPELPVAQLEMKKDLAALAEKRVEGLSLGEQRKRFDAEVLAEIYDDIGTDYSLMGAHFLAAIEMGMARALTAVPAKYDADAAAEFDSMGKSDYADKLYKELLTKRPDDYFGREKYGLFLLEQGRYEASREQLLHLLEETDLNTHDRTYALLYLYLAVKGAGADPRAAVEPYLKSLSGGKWPAPLILYFAGQETEAKLLHDLQQGRAQGNLCETMFYIGVETEINGDKRKAVTFYSQVLRTNYMGYSEYDAAQKRLRVLLPAVAGSGS